MARDGATSAFAGEPQPVEVFHRGRWYAGELLGWRHDEHGHCSARVRCVVDNLRHSAWVALSDLRLPVPAGSTPPPAPRRARPPVPAPPAHDDTQPHLLLPRPGGRPPVPRVAAPPAASRPPAVVPGPAADAVPTPRAIRVQEAVVVG
jgi:hypothetical protein